MPPLIIFLLLFIFVSGLILIAFVFHRVKKYIQSRRIRLREDLPKDSTFEYNKIFLGTESLELNTKFDHGILIHGTFVGDDPFHLSQYFQNLFPNFDPSFIASIKNKVKSNNEFFSKDLGNFTSYHEKILEEKYIKDGEVRSLVWSSANTHLARLNGVISLIHHIDKYCDKGNKLIILSHSHGGQILALYTQILKDHFVLKNLLVVCGQVNLYKSLRQSLKSQDGLNIFMVTMGMPVRYKWVRHKSIDILHIINHRSNEPYGGDIKGSMFTKTGDYIQQWGGAGSDSYITGSEERLVNAALDKYLDIGCNVSVLKGSMESKRRIHNLGHHILIDLNDNSITPNFYKTIFGHGTYTKKRVFMGILNTITRRLNS